MISKQHGCEKERQRVPAGTSPRSGCATGVLVLSGEMALSLIIIVVLLLVVTAVEAAMEHDFLFSLQEVPNSGGSEEAAWMARASNTSITKQILGDAFDPGSMQCGIKAEDGKGVRPFKILMSSTATHGSYVLA